MTGRVQTRHFSLQEAKQIYSMSLKLVCVIEEYTAGQQIHDMHAKSGTQENFLGTRKPNNFTF